MVYPALDHISLAIYEEGGGGSGQVGTEGHSMLGTKTPGYQCVLIIDTLI